MMNSVIRIVFENENFVVCDKLSEVLSTPDRHRSDRPCLGIELQKNLNIQIYPVHRLDFEVSGLIIYAKNKNAHKISQDWFLKKQITKRYQALSHVQNFSHWPENVMTVRDHLAITSDQSFYWKTQIQRGKRRSFESIHGEWAETQAHMLTAENDLISWNLFPLTGKPHQLRLEMSRRGFPILGDQLYGSKTKITPDIWKHGSMALRAVEIDLSAIVSRMGLPEQILV
jgi:tRNA pseudouridine32 synthase / 23S rRNA pseudouridine746 synthase